MNPRRVKAFLSSYIVKRFVLGVLSTADQLSSGAVPRLDQRPREFRHETHAHRYLLLT